MSATSSYVSIDGEKPAEGRIAAFFRVRVVMPFKVALRAGTSPDSLALTMTMAVVCGLFPVLGLTAVLCFLAAWRLGLNTPIMQAINLVLTPLDVALSLPFMRVGEFVLRRDPLPLSPAELIASIKEAGFWNAFGMLATGLGCAIVGWVFVMGPCGTALYFGLRPVLRKIMRKKHDAMMDDPLRGEEMEDPLLPRTRRRSTPDFPSTSS